MVTALATFQNEDDNFEDDGRFKSEPMVTTVARMRGGCFRLSAVNKDEVAISGG